MDLMGINWLLHGIKCLATQLALLTACEFLVATHRILQMDAITSSSQESDTDTSARVCDYAANLHTINI